MKIIKTILASLLILSIAANSFGFEHFLPKNKMEINCNMTCCEKDHHAKKSQEKQNRDCCTSNFCSMPFGCSYYVLSRSIFLKNRYHQMAVKPSDKAVYFVLDKFITDVFQPPETVDYNC